MNKTIKVVLELDPVSVEYIEAVAEADIKSLLESEINENPDALIEMLGLDNY